MEHPDDALLSMQRRFASMTALLEEARRSPDHSPEQVAAAERVLTTITALYAAMCEELRADYREAQQLGDTTKASAIRDALNEMDEGPGALIRQWRLPGEPEQQD